MSCATVTKALSDGDGRVTRRRDVRAHLRNCVRCQAFREELASRQRDLAALSPLPAVAAAGMLHGLVSGGSQGAATGGLMTTLGGGAAKTIGASAAAKGVATVAVVAAIGVTAADRSGVIHLGLPGDQATRSAAPAPAPTGSAPESKDEAHGFQGNHGLDGARKGLGDAGEAAVVASPQAKATPLVGAGAHSGSAAAQSPEKQHPHEQVSAEAQGPQGEHPSGQDHEKQHPEAAAGGQETAGGHKPASAEPPSESGAGHAVTPIKPSHPEPPAHPEASSQAKSSAPAVTPTHAPPGEAPANPPAAPEPPAPNPSPKAEGSPGSQGSAHSEEASGKAR